MSEEVVNLRRLSEMLGLSQTTVSRALNGFPEVSERTRQRVIEAARTHKYRPSQSAASLATGRTQVIGHVIPLSDHMMINPHFSDFIAGAGEAYGRHGYDMLLRVVPSEAEGEVYRELASRKRVDGVVIHGPAADDPRIPLIQSLGLPFVVHGRSGHPEESYAWLDVNNRRAFLRATRFLLDLGHRRIALINGLETMYFARRRRQGYEAALQDAGISPDPSLIFSEDMIEPYGFRVATELLNHVEYPTAIVCASVLPAMGVLRAMSERNLKVGRDVSLVVFDDCLSFLQASGSRTRQDVPFFTAMRSSIRDAGSTVARMLVDRIAAPEAPPKQVLWEAELIVGQTTGPAPN